MPFILIFENAHSTEEQLGKNTRKGERTDPVSHFITTRSFQRASNISYTLGPGAVALLLPCYRNADKWSSDKTWTLAERRGD